MYDTALTRLIEHNEWAEIPLKITTREGRIVDSTNNTWHPPYSMKAHTTLDFSTIVNQGLRWITKRYIQEKIQTTSTHAGYSAFQDIRRHIDQNGKEYYLKDLLLVRHRGLSSGAYTCWIATMCTGSMMTTFLRYFHNLAAQYASSTSENNFNSHHFRHTLNTLLDEGGLSDLLQTEWFGRKNPRDTKAYQHTSREKRALMLREDIKNGHVGGQIVDKLKSIPITVQDAFLKARVNAVHDVGAGICVHNFVQTPCERHLQCSADCKDYVWVKDDKGRVDDLKRQ